MTGITGSIIAASNAATIVITTASTAGLVNSQSVTISGVGGNTAANGTFFIRVLNATTFELYKNPELTVGQAGNGAFTSGGTWSRGTSKFRVAAIGDNTSVSPIGSLLGIVKEISVVQDDPNTTENEANDGSNLIGASLLKRPTIDQFYVQASGSKAFANVTVASSNINLAGSLGILDWV